jgi:hypothetical protein
VWSEEVKSILAGESRTAIERLRQSRGVLWCLFCFGLLLAVLCLVRLRYSQSRNFEPIHVQLTGGQFNGCRVFYQSKYGTWGELAVDSRYSNRWMQSPVVNGVVLVLVECRPGQQIPSEAAEVRVGSNWGTARVVSGSRNAAPEKLPVGVARNYICLEFSPPQRSWVPLARGTINWQGDLWLVLVPLIQVVTLSGTGLICRGLIRGIRSTTP